MPLTLQLQVWLYFGPFIAALLLVPTVVGVRPIIVNGTPTVYFCETSRDAVLSEYSEHSSRALQRKLASSYVCGRLTPPASFERSASTVSPVINGVASTRAP